MSAYCLIFHRTTPRTDTLLEPAPERIRWQGPDGLHHYQDTRLEILYAHHATTSPATKETLPLTSSDGQVTLVGSLRLNNSEELHRRLNLQTQVSDGALALAAYQRWADDCFLNLYGDFSLAIWDRKRDCLLLGRDCFGVRPQFFYADAQRLVVCTDLKVLRSLPFVNAPKVGVSPMVTWEFTTSTPWKGVRKTAPAHWLKWTGGAVESAAYWRPHASPAKAGTLEEWREHLWSGFQRAVERCLVTGCIVGSHLSGGLDSSVVSIIAHRALQERGSTLHLLSSCPPPVPDLPPDDERVYVQMVADAEGSETLHHCPFRGSLNQFRRGECSGWENRFEDKILEKARELGLGVILTGLGGDETLTHHGVGAIRQLILERDWTRIGRLLAGRGEHWRLFLSEVIWKASPVAKRSDGFTENRLQALLESNLSHRMEQFDFMQRNRPIEYRHPFLDRKFVELCLQVPLAFWHRQRIWRNLLEDLLPWKLSYVRLKADVARLSGVT